MSKEDVADASTNVLCEAWEELIFGENREQIYDFFAHEQEVLVEHLEFCQICPHFLVLIEPMRGMLVNMVLLKSLTPQGFAVLIQEIYSNAQAMGFKDDEGDEDAGTQLLKNASRSAQPFAKTKS